MEMTINQLMELTGKSFRTVKKRLEPLNPVREDGRAAFYDTKAALELLYPTVASELARENLLLERARREKVEIEVGQMRGVLVPIKEVVKNVEREYSFVRSQLRALPSKLAKPLSMTIDPNEVHTRLSEAVDECLTELTADAKYEHDCNQIESARNSVAEVPEADLGTESTIKSSGMGRSVPVSEPGIIEHSGQVEDGKRRSRTRANARRNRPAREEDHSDGSDTTSEDGAD
jgi:hypothetical protein